MSLAEIVSNIGLIPQAHLKKTAFYSDAEGVDNRLMNISIIKRRLVRVVLCSIPSLLAINPALAQSPLAAQLEIFQVQQQVSAGQIYEQLVDVESVSPGTHLEYVLTYRNVSDQTLAGFEIQSPIPLNTFYLAGTVELVAEHQFQVSLDGGETWLEEPVMQTTIDPQGFEVLEEVPARNYTDLLWRISSALLPQQQLQIRYRVEVK